MNRIKELREKKKMTQQELGKLIGKSQTAICLYENGSRIPDVIIAQRLSDALGVKMDTIFMP